MAGEPTGICFYERQFCLSTESDINRNIFEIWIEEGINDRERMRYFKVKGSDGNIYVTCYNEKSMEM